MKDNAKIAKKFLNEDLGIYWQSTNEIEKIFKDYGFSAQIFIHDGDLLRRDKPSLYLRFGWHFYHAILWLKN